MLKYDGRTVNNVLLRIFGESLTSYDATIGQDIFNANKILRRQ